MKINRFRKHRNILIILRNAISMILIILAAVSLYLLIYSNPFKFVFPVKHFLFSGNRHLTDDELKAFSCIKKGESLLSFSNEDICKRMLKSPWIKSVNIKKIFPSTLLITIKEAEPFALLEMNEHLFLIDDQGNLLEEIRDKSVPFLPVITGDPFRDKQGLKEAINLANAMNRKGLSTQREHIEIKAYKPHEITAVIDGLEVKIGEGQYEEKLDKLLKLEEDIKNMGIHVDYIDLRFSGRAFVKPVIEKVIK
ncbi:MAG: FtsQ-type POTRA domain-containing protein [Nitrospirae bacterium]|jgi:cell division protein FtsQ|nr:FtsQ-type POTRA domain-containing protein [Nitrospirota bacterium]